MKRKTDAEPIGTIEEQVEEFFKRRFPEKDIAFEKRCGYFHEWVRRWETGYPENYMDLESTKVYADMLREKADKLIAYLERYQIERAQEEPAPSAFKGMVDLEDIVGVE